MNKIRKQNNATSMLSGFTGDISTVERVRAIFDPTGENS